jgi:polar amino acid transport system ATP-binding protein
MNTAENISETGATGRGAPVLAARRISMQDRYSMERLRDLTLEIYEGDVVALIGASEPAKRLLLRCLDLLEKPEAGNVEVNGEPVMWRRGGADRARRAVGMALSRESLFLNLNVMGNMTIAPSDNAGEEEGLIRERAKSLLEFAGLSGLSDAMPVNLTAGQRRRLAIVRALMLQPRILLIENPGDKLGPEEKYEVYALIRAVVKKGMTILFSTSDLEFAREIATRVVFMVDGMIREDGAPEEVMDHPQFDRTQSFVRKNSGFYRELNAHAFDSYAFDAEVETFCIGKLVPPEKRRTICEALKILFARMLFPHVSRVVLTLEVKPEKGEVTAVAQYPGSGFDPLTQGVGADSDAAKAVLRDMVKSMRYRLPVAGKNEFVVVF